MFLIYALIVALYCEKMEKDLERITKINRFINKYNWEGKNFCHQKQMIGKTNEKLKVTITISIIMRNNF